MLLGVEQLRFNSCVGQGSLENGATGYVQILKDSLWELAHMIREAEKSHHLPSANWRPREVGSSSDPKS